MSAAKATRPALITWKQRRFLEDLWAELGKDGPLPITKQGARDAIQHALRRREHIEPPLTEQYRRFLVEKPTETQLHDLGVLTRRAGEPMPHVATRGDAAREVNRLKQGKPKVP